MKNSDYVKKLLMFVFVLSSSSAFSRENQTIPLREYDLVGIDLDTSETQFTRWIHCSLVEIRNGLSDSPWSGPGKAPGRELTPTKQPLGRKASWLISNDDKGCRSMKPYFNVVGFESFNPSTGEVLAYIGAFNQNDKISNVVKFRGTCSFPNLDTSEEAWKKNHLVCDFGRSGQITLALR